LFMVKMVLVIGRLASEEQDYIQVTERTSPVSALIRT
jgi:hypothetical protein